VGSRQPAPEALLWSYLCQLCTAIKQVHANGSALRCISAAHVLATTGNKVRVSGVGVMDVLEHEQATSLSAKQREDIVNLGTCLLTVASRCFVTNQNVAQCLASLQG
jgi:PAB-dependent poly(A)-specific ribonuclease subunit 3